MTQAEALSPVANAQVPSSQVRPVVRPDRTPASTTIPASSDTARQVLPLTRPAGLREASIAARDATREMPVPIPVIEVTKVEPVPTPAITMEPEELAGTEPPRIWHVLPERRPDGLMPAAVAGLRDPGPVQAPGAVADPASPIPAERLALDIKIFRATGSSPLPQAFSLKLAGAETVVGTAADTGAAPADPDTLVTAATDRPVPEVPPVVKGPVGIAISAVVLDDTYARPFDIDGTGDPRLQKLPRLRPDGIGSPDTVILASKSGAEPLLEEFADQSIASVAQMPPEPATDEVPPEIDTPDPEPEPGVDESEPALRLMQRLSGHAPADLPAADIAAPAVETAADGLVDIAPMEYDSIDPDAAMSASPTIADIRPDGLLETDVAEDFDPTSFDAQRDRAAALDALGEIAGSGGVPLEPFGRQEPARVPVQMVPAQPEVDRYQAPLPASTSQGQGWSGNTGPQQGVAGSMGNYYGDSQPVSTASYRDKGIFDLAPAPDPNSAAMRAQLRIELSYVESREAVQGKVTEIRKFFPPAILAKGRFFGATVPTAPGIVIVGFEANDIQSRDDVVWYMEHKRTRYPHSHLVCHWISQAELARQYGVSYQRVYQIVHGRRK